MIGSNKQRICSETELPMAVEQGRDMESASKEAQEESRACSPGLAPDKLPG